MDHGIDAYFAEQARFARRVSIVTVIVGLAGLGALWAGRARSVQDALTDTARRFGYEGRDQYVRRITLQQYRGSGPELRDVGKVEPRGTRGGAKDDPHGSVGHRAPRRLRLTGPGDASADLSGLLVSRIPNVPVVQSDELVIVDLVRPTYPSEALDQGLEGKVQIQALIDTTGKVVDVQLLSNTGVGLFAQAASEAVWKCRFLPYRAGGATSEVYAIFRFSFRINS